MSKPYATPNNVESTIAAENSWTRGTDTSVVLTDASLFDAGGGYIRIGDDDSYAEMVYTGKSSNTLTGLAVCTLGKVVSVGDETKTWPAGTVVARVLMGEDLDDRVAKNQTAPAAGVTSVLGIENGETVMSLKALPSLTELGYVDGVTSGIQTQLDGKPGTTTASVTLYVDKAGNDGNAGTAIAPKLTITGALNALPITLAHACYINVGKGTYTESLTTPLARLNIIASLTIRAVDTSDVALHVRGAAAAGANTTVDVEDAHVTADDQWNGAQIIIYGDTGSGQIRDITDSATSNNRLTVATWETNPASGSDYVLTGLVVVDGNTATAMQLTGVRNLFFEGIRFTSSGTDAVNCVELLAVSFAQFTDCLFDDKYAFSCDIASSAYTYYCGWRIPASGYGLVVQQGGFVLVVYGTVYGAKSSDYGVYIASGGTVNVSYLQVRHCATGVYATAGGWQLGSYITYTDNTTKANPDAPASTADIVTDGFSFIQDQS